MEMLKKRILEQGRVLEGDIVKVDSFLNHRMDIDLIEEIGKEIASIFKRANPTIIMTVEASGIALAYAAAKRMNLPMVFAKKGKSHNIGTEIYAADVFSYTRKATYGVYVSKKYISSEDRVLIVDDFLANGQAALGLISICEQAGAKVAGIAIAIEKKWQRGSELLHSKGYPLYSLAVISKIENGQVVFDDQRQTIDF